MTQLHLVWELARKDLHLFVADRRGVLLCFAVPVALASIFGAVFHRPEGAGEVRPHAFIVAEGNSPRLARLAGLIAGSPQLDARRGDAASARRWLAEESSGVVVVLPAGLGEASAGGARPSVVLRHHPNSQLESRLVEGVLTEVVMRELAREHLGRLAGPGAGGLLERPFQVERHAQAAGGALAAHSFSHSFCGITVQYLLFWGLDSGLLFLRERRLGIWRRLRCAPVAFSTLLAGKALATATIALAQIVVTLGVGAVVFGIRVNGSWLGLALMAGSASMLSAATGLVVATLSGTEMRARSVSILVILVLSLLGGLWIPAFLLPGWVQAFALALPTTWAARGLEGVVWQGMSLSGAWPCAAALVGFSGLFLLIAYWRLWTSERRNPLAA